MVTQKQIADKLSVSVSLVSRALSGTASSIGVPADTTERIRNAAVQLGYIPNLSARILKGSPTRILGLVVYDFEDPFFAPIIGELQRLAHEQQYSLVLGGFEDRRVSALDVRALFQYAIDGLIIIGSGHNLKWVKALASSSIPLARIGSGPHVKGLRSFQLDEAEGLSQVLGHLVRAGHRRIAFIGREDPLHRQRYTQFVHAVQEHGLRAPQKDAAFSRARLTDAGYEAAQNVLKRRALSRRPTALVASSDLVALGALRALAEMDLRVPEDIAVTGFDDISMARLSVPALTTIRQPVTLMAQKAFEWITGSDRAGTHRVEVFAPELVVRESA